MSLKESPSSKSYFCLPSLFCYLVNSPSRYLYLIGFFSSIREKRALLLNNLSGKDFTDAKLILDSTIYSDKVESQRLEANSLSNSAGIEHSAISFHLMPSAFNTFINWREENRQYVDLTSRVSYQKPFSFLVHKQSSWKNYYTSFIKETCKYVCI